MTIQDAMAHPDGLLIYADYLDEQGDELGAELCRLQHSGHTDNESIRSTSGCVTATWCRNKSVSENWAGGVPRSGSGAAAGFCRVSLSGVGSGHSAKFKSWSGGRSRSAVLY